MNNFGLYVYAQIIRVRTLLAYRGKSWRNLPIKESNESLVVVPAEMCHSFYCLEMKLTDDPVIFLRKSTLDMYLDARRIVLSLGYDILVYDGWRSLVLQENLFWYYLKKFTVARFNVQEKFANAESPQEIEDLFNQLPESLRMSMKEANRTYVSWPSSNPLSPSPHSTGGSIDVWLYRNGQPLNLGVPFDWMDDEAGAFYHLKTGRKKFFGNDGVVCSNRNILLYAMSKAGFSCYGPEIWHFNYGNQMDALVKGNVARYSYIEP
jgi:D-alanyl-D-alanine dipeptidase